MHQQPNAQRKKRIVLEIHVFHSILQLLGEWDLNDPDYLRKDVPARVSDDDPRCGIASLQKFQGEDLNARARNQYQKEQLREWSRLQQEDQRRAQQQQHAADQLFHAKQIELDQRAMALQRAEEQCRRDINKSVRSYNDALVSSKKLRKFFLANFKRITLFSLYKKEPNLVEREYYSNRSQHMSCSLKLVLLIDIILCNGCRKIIILCIYLQIV